MTLVFVGLIAFSSGLVKGTSGFGSSLVALPLLLIFYPFEEVVVMMITYNVVLNSLLHFENKDFSINHLKEVWVLAMFGIVATFIGIYYLSSLNEMIIKCFAAVLIFFAILNKVSKFKYEFKDNYINQAITGFFSGIGNGVASIDGPPVVFFLTGIQAEKSKFKNTLASYFLMLGIFSVILLGLDGRYSGEILLNTLYAGIFAIIGVVIGMLVSKRLNEEVFEKVIIVLLVFLGISMFIF